MNLEPLAPEPALSTPQSAEQSRPARERLLDGLAQCVADKGYADTTIADIVAAARVSKRTFYQHFPGKEACFSELYVGAVTRSLIALQDVVDLLLPWQDQVERAVLAYLDTLADYPPRARTLYIEILRMGAPGLAMRRAAHDRFAHWIVTVLSMQKNLDPEARVMAYALARAVVGGIHELVLAKIEIGDFASLPTLAAPAGQLVRAIFGSMGEGAPLAASAHQADRSA